MGVGLSVLALAGEFSRAVSGVTLMSDSASHDQEEIRSIVSVTDLNIEDVEDVSSVSSGVEETKIESVIKRTRCTRSQAVNSLLTHDMNIEQAVMFIRDSNEDAQSFDSSSSVPVCKPLPSGRVWGKCPSEVSSVPFGISSQRGVGGSRVSSSLGDGYNELFSACRSGDAGVVKRLLQDNTDMDVNKELKGQVDDLQKRHGDDADSGCTALHIACAHEHFSVVQELLHHPDIKVNTEDRLGNTILHIVVNNGRSDIMRLLLAHPRISVNNTGANRQFSQRKRSQRSYHHLYSTALHVACELGHLDIAEQLIERKDTDVNVYRFLKKPSNVYTGLSVGVVHEYHTPLMLACIKGHSQIVKCLLTRADVETGKKLKHDTLGKGKKGQSALDMASEKGHEDMVQMLQDYEKREDVIQRRVSEKEEREKVRKASAKVRKTGSLQRRKRQERFIDLWQKKNGIIEGSREEAMKRVEEEEQRKHHKCIIS